WWSPTATASWWCRADPPGTWPATPARSSRTTRRAGASSTRRPGCPKTRRCAEPAAAMRMTRFVCALAALLGLRTAESASAQFRDDFDTVALDPDAKTGWEFFTGDGTATMDFRQGGAGYASIFVDATTDGRGIWWALIEREVSAGMDLSLLRRPGHEVRIEARIRVSHAPRRVNMQVLTRRTTDYYSHLMEFDIPDAET